MKKLTYLLLALFLFASCSDDEGVIEQPFVIAFDELSSNILDSNAIRLSFSEPAQHEGYIKIKVNSVVDGIETEYGVDFRTNPAVESGFIILPFGVGDTMVSFEFISLFNSLNEEDQGKSVHFIIEEIDYASWSSIQGYTQHISSFDVKVGGTESPNIGGPNEPYQVYFDLSTGEYTLVQRDSWDLGFYSGEEFRVILNGSIYMATKNLETYNIDDVTENNIPAEYFENVKIGTFDPANEEFIDNPNGDIADTAIQEIQIEADENEVYLLNLGYEVGTDQVNNGSVDIAGEARGWKKIRILRQDNGYLLQYADINESTHLELFIPKLPEYNFNFFSFNTESVVEVQPPKNDWDLCFTVFTNVVTDNNGNPSGSYGFSDFVVNNILNNSKAFMLKQEDGYYYDDYTFNETEAEAMLPDDQRAIGSYWRSVFQGVYSDRFFVIRDTEGNWYKIKFLALTNENGERGHPKFKYELLQTQNTNKIIDKRII